MKVAEPSQGGSWVSQLFIFAPFGACEMYLVV